ncbi:MAG TPA: UvrD-helicase domain-containing protein, partial [Chloroflexota bacterium]
MSTLLSDLNPEQRLAVQHDDGPLLVAAGPGSGKTRVITHRIAYRVLESGVSPSRILAVTFTNRAAREMSERVGALVGDDTRVPVGTFHWMCAGILRRYIHLLGNRSNFRVLTPRESHQVLRSLLPTHATSSTRHTGTVADAISGLKSGVEDAGVARDFGIPEDELARLRLAYDERLRAMNALDLDDLPALAGRVLREHESCKNTCRSALDELLVDEYQDTNLIQQELVELLC